MWMQKEQPSGCGQGNRSFARRGNAQGGVFPEAADIQKVELVCGSCRKGRGIMRGVRQLNCSKLATDRGRQEFGSCEFSIVGGRFA